MCEFSMDSVKYISRNSHLFMLCVLCKCFVDIANIYDTSRTRCIINYVFAVSVVGGLLLKSYLYQRCMHRIGL